MNVKPAITSQYQASLEMLKLAIQKCPEACWDDPVFENRFWQVSYHALFFTHLYLQPSLEDFTPWVKHSAQAEQMGSAAKSQETGTGRPYTRAEVLEYLELCQDQVVQRVASLNPDAASGFHWLPFSKLELQFYNIRHLQQHIGELCERLGTGGHGDVAWVAMKLG